jgi:hypothetical protein
MMLSTYCGVSITTLLLEFLCVESEVSLYNIILRDMYDDLIMPEPKKVHEEIVLAGMQI